MDKMLQKQDFSKEVKLYYSSVKPEVYILKNVKKIRFTNDTEKFGKINVKK